MHSHYTTVKTLSLKSVWKKTVTCSWRRSQHFVDWTGYHESIHGDLYRPSTVLQLFHYLWLHQRSTVSDVQHRSLDRRRPLHKNNINEGCTSCAKKWTYVSYGTIIYNVIVGLSNDAVKRCGCMFKFKFKFKVACLGRQSLSGQAPLYFADDCRLVSDSTRRSALCGQLTFRLAWCLEHSAVTATELLLPQDLACGTLFQSNCVIPTSNTDCSDDS